MARRVRRPRTSPRKAAEIVIICSQSGGALMHAGRISGERREIARRQWINDVGHCRHAAADALAGLEILQRFQEIIFALPRQSCRGAVAIELLAMTRRAAVLCCKCAALF